MKSFRDYLKEEFKDKDYEERFYRGLEKVRIAAEILYYREQHHLTQADLARMIKTSQSAIARLEDPDYEGYSIKVLRKIAAALNLKLVVTFDEKIESRKQKRLAKVIRLPWVFSEENIDYDVLPFVQTPLDKNKLKVA